MHNGFVTVNREKMSKSLGNFFTLSEIFAKYHPSVVRYMLLTVHYRSPLDFSSEILDQARQSLSGLKDSIARATFVLRRQSDMMDQKDGPPGTVVVDTDRFYTDFLEALGEDFNTPAALSELHGMTRLLEQQFATNTVSLASVRYILKRLKEA